MAATDNDVDMPQRRGRAQLAATRLFRDEVLAARGSRWLGTVLVDARQASPWHRGFTLFAALAAAALLGLLYFGEFTRKAHVSGWLVPQGGLVRVFAPQPGVVTALSVKEGTAVKKGAPLLTLSAELASASLGATQAEVARQIKTRRQLLIGQREQSARLLAQQSRSLTERLATLHSEQTQIEREIALQRSRAALAARTEMRHRGLRADGFISEQQFQQTQEASLEQAGRLSTLERTRIATTRERLALEAELKDLPLKAQTDVSVIERDIAALEGELAQAEARRAIVVTAPQDGTVTAILAELGGQAGAARPLLAIVPAGMQLEAHLFSPSRAVGFVSPGQHVLLRYQAYPYQKFGHYDGVVESVSRSALNAGELAPLAGASSPRPATANEPVYRITVRLLQQCVTAYGRQVPLQADMQIDADIALDKRRLYEWVLDPLYTITGKGRQG